MNKKEIITDVILAFIISVLYVSAVFIAGIISCNSSVLSFVYVGFTAVLYGFSLISRNKKAWLFKWGLSVPVSYFVIQYFRSSNYLVRALNWVYPGYGKPSAGGTFAGFVLIIMLSVSCLICGITGLFIKTDNFKKYEKKQLIVALFFAVLTVAAVLILESQFPSYELAVG